MKDFDLGQVLSASTGLDAFFESEPEIVPQPEVAPVKVASGMRKVASLGDLSGFIRTAEDQLVHKSTQDLWALRTGDDGQFYIERLFDDRAPLKG